MRWRFEWTPERCDLLRALRATGHSAREIAEKLRDGLTRNAVLGKAFRLKIPWNTEEAAQRPKRPYRRRKKRGDTEVFPVKHPKPPQAVMRPTPMPPPTTPPPTDQLVDIMDLTNETCRWPIDVHGLPTIKYCGHPSADLAAGYPYCAYHNRIARGKDARYRVEAAE